MRRPQPDGGPTPSTPSQSPARDRPAMCCPNTPQPYWDPGPCPSHPILERPGVTGESTFGFDGLSRRQTCFLRSFCQVQTHPMDQGCHPDTPTSCVELISSWVSISLSEFSIALNPGDVPSTGISDKLWENPYIAHKE